MFKDISKFFKIIRKQMKEDRLPLTPVTPKEVFRESLQQALDCKQPKLIYPVTDLDLKDFKKIHGRLRELGFKPNIKQSNKKEFLELDLHSYHGPKSIKHLL